MKNNFRIRVKALKVKKKKKKVIKSHGFTSAGYLFYTMKYYITIKKDILGMESARVHMC